MCQEIDPAVHFPIPPDEVSRLSHNAKPGDRCLVAWSFDCTPILNVSSGTVKTSRKVRNVRKLALSYEGIIGHNIGEVFDGHIPPHSNVRIFRLLWEPRVQQNSEPSKTYSRRQHTEDDLDREPMPTLRTVSPEYIPCVVAIYRDIMREYADSSYPHRYRIWHRVLSAMKYSLATIRKVTVKRRRRRPLDSHDDQESSQENHELQRSEGTVPNADANDKRAIKKATSLVLDGCVSKASQIMDREITAKSQSDEEIVEKLIALHPNLPTSFRLPQDAPITACITPSELREAGRRLAKGASPGPTGTTDSILRILLDDEVCCLSLTHMFTDLINGVLPEEVMKRLKRARLVAIPKTAQGIRPIAVGEVWLKIAEIVLLQRHEKTLPPLFSPHQFGVMIKSGCEKVVQELDERYAEGCAILSIDLKNAFNSPSRDEIARAVFGFHSLRPFLRLFNAEYGSPSELLYYGKDGRLCNTVMSAAGVRQGSPLSTILFCAFLQPILETIASEFPTLRIYAFVDDINFASTDAEMVSNAFLRLKELLTSKRVETSSSKCIWFGGINHIPLPHQLMQEGVNWEPGATKVLGAFVGDSHLVSEKLVQMLQKHRTAFRRLQQMGANNVSVLLLSKCINVRHRYHIRVHHPENTSELTRQFDGEVSNTLSSWFGGLTEKQISWTRLPLKKGGLGITPSEPIREAAYTKSKQMATERPIYLSAPAPCTGLATQLTTQPNHNNPSADEPTTEDLHHKYIRDKLMEEPRQADILRATSAKGSYTSLASSTRLVPS